VRGRRRQLQRILERDYVENGGMEDGDGRLRQGGAAVVPAVVPAGCVLGITKEKLKGCLLARFCLT
jgi:hypothetical protein